MGEVIPFSHCSRIKGIFVVICSGVRNYYVLGLSMVGAMLVGSSLEVGWWVDFD